MTGQDIAPPSRVYARRDSGVDPPSVALGLDLERSMAEGDVALFVDDGAEPATLFELRRTGGAFRLCDLLSTPTGTFASADAAIRAGWRLVDGLHPRCAGAG